MAKVLGIDYGDARIGLAVAETIIGIAHPHAVIESNEKAVQEIADLVGKENIETIVIGLPLSLSGEEGTQASEVRRFAEDLAKITKVYIKFQDERLSSRQAENILISMDKSRDERKAGADAYQAAIILQTYLDSSGEG